MFIAAASALIVTLTFPHGPAKVGLQCSEEMVSPIEISMALGHDHRNRPKQEGPWLTIRDTHAVDCVSTSPVPYLGMLHEVPLPSSSTKDWILERIPIKFSRNSSD